MMRDNLILHVVEGSIAQYSINPYRMCMPKEGYKFPYRPPKDRQHTQFVFSPQ